MSTDFFPPYWLQTFWEQGRCALGSLLCLQYVELSLEARQPAHILNLWELEKGTPASKYQNAMLSEQSVRCKTAMVIVK